MTPIETNARAIIAALVQYFPTGATSEEIRRVFEKHTGLARQSYYYALRHAKGQGWLIGGGRNQLYTLNPLERKQLEYLISSQTQQIESLQSENERLRDWSNGDDADGAGVALASLVQIVGDSTASTRQRIKAAAAVLAYKVQDDGVVEFVKRYLGSVCASADIGNVDYKIEAGELLRRHEAPRVTSESVRPNYCDEDEADKFSEALAKVKRRAAICGHSFALIEDDGKRVQHTDLALALREARLRVSAKARAQAGLPVDDVATPADDDD